MEKELYWTRFASDFEQRNNYVAGVENIRIIKEELAQLNLKGKVLELGCGNGTYTQTIALSADELLATDFSQEMVSVASERLGSLKNVRIEQQNCFSLSYANDCFNAVVMVNLLHIISSPENAIKESLRVLKSTGELVVVSFTSEGMYFFDKLGLIYRYLRTYGKPLATSQRLTVAHTCDMLNQHGFSILDSKLIGKSTKAVFVRAKRKE